MADPKAQVQRPPAEGAITVAEIDLEMVALQDDRDNNIARYAAAGGVCYPHIMIPAAIWKDIHTAIVNQRETTNSNTAAIDEHGEQGFVKKVQIRPMPMANTGRGDETHKVTTTMTVPQRKLGVENISSSSSFQETVAWMLQADSREMIQAFMNRIGIVGWEKWRRRWLDPLTAMITPPPSHAVLHRSEWPTTCIAWHPYRQIMAIAHRNDMAFMYNVEEQEWFPDPLHHPLQQDLVQLVWRPNAAGALAAVCRQGIALWRFPLYNWQSTTGSPQAYMTWLHHTAIEDVSCCAWDPTGQYPFYNIYINIETILYLILNKAIFTFLAVAGRADASLLIWHVATETVVPLRRIGSGIASLQWSPDGQYLCTAPREDDALRIWETKTWTAVRAAELSSGVTSIYWAPSSRHLLFSLEKDTHIYVLQLIATQSHIDFRILDEPRSLEAVALRDEEGKMVRVGGVIRSMALDPNGERLAVIFEPQKDKKMSINAKKKGNAVNDKNNQQNGSELIMVFMVRLSSWIGERRPLLQSGYIRGPPAPDYEPGDILNVAHPPHAAALAFAQQFDRGSLLAVAWDNGKITFVPFFYMANSRLPNNSDHQYQNQPVRRNNAW
ncbi:hypothetical protein BDF19DRAFT_412822 [Syncephalis fuscata]|nr:hypothetical protein BDF19DRAFT_412822 [Syncephalis fuscata]